MVFGICFYFLQGVNDGAAAMILVNEQALKDHSLQPLARLVGWLCVAVDPMWMGTAAIPAAQTVLQKTGLTMNDMDLVEVDNWGSSWHP